MNEPVGLWDKVKHKLTDVSGEVIATYKGMYTDQLSGDTKMTSLLDVRSSGVDKIWYGSPARNWEVVKKYEEDD